MWRKDVDLCRTNVTAEVSNLMINYEIPEILDKELDGLESQIQKFRKGDITGMELKAHRVPFGIYEQRKNNNFMIRIRCAGGVVTPRQLKSVAECSGRFGADSIHVSTRQGLQIHDVAIEDIVSVSRQLKEVGLSARGGGGNTVRNIMASWDSGISKDELFDVTPYAISMTSRLIAESDSWVLPRKFKISFSNSERDNANATFNDLGFIALAKNGVKGFRVYVAGGMGTKAQVGHLLHDFIPADQIYHVAEALKQVFSKNGNRKNKHAARLRFLWNKLGRQRFVNLYHDELAELKKKDAKPFEISGIDNKPEANLKIKPLLETSSRFDHWKRRYVRAQKQPGLYSILIPLFLGNIKNEQAALLGDLLSHFGENVLRCTMNQNLSIRNIPADYLGNVYEAAGTISELAAGPQFMGNCIACTGADTCKPGICLSQGALRAIGKKLKQSALDLDDFDELKLNISGCPNTCGQHLAADLGFYGKSARKNQVMYPAYNIVAGAVIRDGTACLARKIAMISARDLPDFVADFLPIYHSKKNNYSSFAAYINDCGETDIKSVCDRYRDIPDFEDDKNYYFDWGAREIFSLVGMGIGECSAGLFDLIEVDRNQIKSQRDRLELLTDSDEISESLYQIVLSAARMLLITRGVEARSDREIFDAFDKHFIDTSLVNLKFKNLISAANDRDYRHLSDMKDRVYELADAIEKLYDSMDDSLRFTSERETKISDAGARDLDEESGGDLSRDYRGVACPMNFVKVKLDLFKMKTGQTLRVLLDDGEPIENVPGSVVAEGHEIVAQKKINDHWLVIIRKR